MRKCSLFIACSIDSYIAGVDGNVEWLFTEQDYGYKAFTDRMDTTVMGRLTYEKVLSFGGEFPYKSFKNYVFSNNEEFVSTEDMEVVRDDYKTWLQTEKQKPGKGIWLIGGGSLNGQFLHDGLIDEIVLSVHPIILGQGTRLFEGDTGISKWTLTNSKCFASGLVQLSYTRDNSDE